MKLALTKQSKLAGTGLVVLGILIGALMMSFLLASRAVLGPVVNQGEPHAMVWAGLSAIAAGLCGVFLIRIRLVQGK